MIPPSSLPPLPHLLAALTPAVLRSLPLPDPHPPGTITHHLLRAKSHFGNRITSLRVIIVPIQDTRPTTLRPQHPFTSTSAFSFSTLSLVITTTLDSLRVAQATQLISRGTGGYTHNPLSHTSLTSLCVRRLDLPPAIHRAGIPLRTLEHVSSIPSTHPPRSPSLEGELKTPPPPHLRPPPRSFRPLRLSAR